MLTTILDIAGALLLIAFAFIIWWPLALAAAGILCLLASFLLTRRAPQS
jgi:hypothetical protein